MDAVPGSAWLSCWTFPAVMIQAGLVAAPGRARGQGQRQAGGGEGGERGQAGLDPGGTRAPAAGTVVAGDHSSASPGRSWTVPDDEFSRAFTRWLHFLLVIGFHHQFGRSPSHAPEDCGLR